MARKTKKAGYGKCNPILLGTILAIIIVILICALARAQIINLNISNITIISIHASNVSSTIPTLEADFLSGIYYIFYVNPFTNYNFSEKIWNTNSIEAMEYNTFCLSLFSIRTVGKYNGPVYIITCLDNFNPNILSNYCDNFLKNMGNNDKNSKITFRMQNTQNMHNNIDSNNLVFSIINDCGYKTIISKTNDELLQKRYWIRYLKTRKNSIFQLKNYNWDNKFYRKNNNLNINSNVLYLDADIILINSISKLYNFKNFDMLMFNDTDFYRYDVSNIYNGGTLLYKNTTLSNKCINEWHNIFWMSIFLVK